ncbi:MAG: ABC transporter permease [Hyphomicrobiales bacterium]
MLLDAIDILFTTGFWVAAIRIASPLIFATMGELICERAGVLNLGIEGIMTVGAFAGWITVYAGGDLWTGVLIAALAGSMFGLLHGVLTVPLGLSQHVTGIGITLLATSLTYFTYRVALADSTSPPKIEPFQPYPVPGLSEIPFVGEILFTQTPLTYLAFIIVAVVAWVLYRTPLGLAVRAAGENPVAVEAQGISVTGIRVGAVMVGSALMAVGGAFLTMSAFNSFFFEMINGRGWICIALVVFGSWRPGKALIGAILFAAFDAYQVRLQQVTGGVIPYQIFLMLPYVLSIVALIVVARRATYPKALMVPYQKGER